MPLAKGEDLQVWDDARDAGIVGQCPQPVRCNLGGEAVQRMAVGMGRGKSVAGQNGGRLGAGFKLDHVVVGFGIALGKRDLRGGQDGDYSGKGSAPSQEFGFHMCDRLS